jgi:hypothetical protein
VTLEMGRSEVFADAEAIGRSSWFARLVLVFVFGLGLILGSTDRARATGNSGYTDSTGPQCAYNWSHIYRPAFSSTAYASGGVRSLVADNGSYCPIGVWSSRPPGYLAVRLVVWKYNSGREFVCKSTGYTYNPGSASRLSRTTSMGKRYNTACGPGYYGTVAYGYVFNDGRWQGGYIWSGWKYLK